MIEFRGLRVQSLHRSHLSLHRISLKPRLTEQFHTAEFGEAFASYRFPGFQLSIRARMLCAGAVPKGLALAPVAPGKPCSPPFRGSLYQGLETGCRYRRRIPT